MSRAALALLALSLAACGVKGPPRPPGVEEAAAPVRTVSQPGLEGVPADAIVPEAVPRADEPEAVPGADEPEAEPRTDES